MHSNRIQKQPIEFYNIDNGCLWYVQPLFIGPSMELYWFASLYPKQMSSVPVMISSVYLFLGIKHLTFKSNFINKLSAHTLAVYLISEHTCLFKWFWTDILRTDKLWNAGIFEYLGYSSLIILSVFVSCILIDYIIKNTIYKILPNTPKFLINIEHYFKIKT